jgi:hypothetical protein
MHVIRIAVEANSERLTIFFSTVNPRTNRPPSERALREGWGILHLAVSVDVVRRAIALLPGIVVLVAID